MAEMINMEKGRLLRAATRAAACDVFPKAILVDYKLLPWRTGEVAPPAHLAV